MLNNVLATVLVWGVVLFAMRVYLSRWAAAAWVHKTITVTGAALAILSVMGVALYAALQELLADNSLLWSFS
jgi:hypothetical protein